MAEPLIEVRTHSDYGFRTGEWGRVVEHGARTDGRPTWAVRFADGTRDLWVADDALGRYETRPLYVGEIADPEVENWTKVVLDADRDYVSYCLRWDGYRLLRTRVRDAVIADA